MEPQLQHTHGRHFDDPETHNAGLQTVLEGHGYNEDDQHHQQHGEKKSVIKKVKEKAKKLKDTITKHGHGHDDHDHDYHEGDNEDGDDEEMEEDPEVHGGPMYDSTAVGSRLAGQDAVLAQPRGNLERPSVLAEDRYSSHSDEGGPPVRPFGRWEGEGEESHGAPAPLPTGPPAEGVGHHAYGQQTGMEEPHRSRTGGKEREVKIGQSTGMVEDPHSPKDSTSRVSPSNYETKVTDTTHTGGQETGITPIIQSFGKMDIYNENESGLSKSDKEGQKLYSGSHDQFAPEPVPKRFEPDHPEDLPRDTITGNPSSYTEKISSATAAATSAIADKATAAKSAIASKLGYSSQDETSTGSHETTEKSASPKEYAHKIASTVTETLAPVYDKVVDAGSSVMSKMQGTGTGTGTGTGQQEMHKGPDDNEGKVQKESDKGIGVKEYLYERFAPREEDKALSEVITHAFQRGKDGEPEKKSGEDRQAMGRVTESEEVRRSLGSDRDEQQQQHSSNVSADKSVADRLKGAVGSWFVSKGNAPEGSMGTSYVTDEGLSSTASGGDDGEARSQ